MEFYPNIIAYDILNKYIEKITFSNYNNDTITNINDIFNTFEYSNNHIIKLFPNKNIYFYNKSIYDESNKIYIFQNYLNIQDNSNHVFDYDFELSYNKDYTYENNKSNKNNENNENNENDENIENNENDENDENDENIENDENNEQDAWDIFINDDKFYINNKVARIFPILKNFNNFCKIKIDDDSFSYITIREIADVISKIICYHLLKYNLNPQKINIIDYTAGVGGNILSFCKYFNYIYGIELSTNRSEYLENNINVYGFKNVKVINKCAIEFNNNNLIEINPNVIFIDPPWGGINYKNNDKLTLSLGNIEIENLVIDIATKFSIEYKKITELNPKEKNNNKNNKFIILKLPKNYDIELFYNYIKQNNNLDNYDILVFLYILNKMLIIVCELKYKNF